VTGNEPAVRGGAEELHDGCAPTSQNKGAVETTLLSLDRTTYQIGDVPVVELQVKNVGTQSVEMPVLTNLADVQPADPTKKFAYYALLIEVMLGGKQWSTNTGGTVSLYGDNDQNGSMLSLRPGEWLRIKAKARIELPGDVATLISSGDIVSQANAKSSLYRKETLLTSTAAATVSTQLCLDDSQGRALPIHIAER
jgi:hypothetical protein